jgi:hypothetical protein
MTASNHEALAYRVPIVSRATGASATYVWRCDSLSLRELFGVREPLSTLAMAWMGRLVVQKLDTYWDHEPGIPGGETPAATEARSRGGGREERRRGRRSPGQVGMSRRQGERWASWSAAAVTPLMEARTWGGSWRAATILELRIGTMNRGEVHHRDTEAQSQKRSVLFLCASVPRW